MGSRGAGPERGTVRAKAGYCRWGMDRCDGMLLHARFENRGGLAQQVRHAYPFRRAVPARPIGGRERPKCEEFRRLGAPIKAADRFVPRPDGTDTGMRRLEYD